MEEKEDKKEDKKEEEKTILRCVRCYKYKDKAEYKVRGGDRLNKTCTDCSVKLQKYYQNKLLKQQEKEVKQ